MSVLLDGFYRRRVAEPAASGTRREQYAVLMAQV